MLIVFGWGHQKTKILGSVLPRECENCHNCDAWVLVDVSNWFSLFFLPIFPYQVRHLLVCPVCGSGIELTRNDFLTLRGGSSLTDLPAQAPQVQGRMILPEPVEARSSSNGLKAERLLRDPIEGMWRLHSISHTRMGERRLNPVSLGLDAVYQFDERGRWFGSRSTPTGEDDDNGTWHNAGGGEYVLSSTWSGLPDDSEYSDQWSGFLQGDEYCEAPPWSNEGLWLWFHKVAQ